jgi:anti-sigma regulatory factor (Ser/Thr protein kinase)
VTKLAVPHQAASAASVRHRLSSELRAVGIAPSVVADATLVLTELVTNAVRHAPPLDGVGMAVGWLRAGDQLRVWVSDGGSDTATPVPQAAGPTATSGRGLAIVEALAQRWGVDDEPDRRTVWAQLALSA